jgi:hypothetical protein
MHEHLNLEILSQALRVNSVEGDAKGQGSKEQRAKDEEQIRDQKSEVSGLLAPCSLLLAYRTWRSWRDKEL